MWTATIVVKLPRLALQVEMSWHHSLVLGVGQYIVTQLSKLLGCRLNMDVLFVEHKWSKYPLVYPLAGNPLAVLKCQLRDSTFLVSTLPVDSSTLGVADHHSKCYKGVDSRVVSAGEHI